MEPIEYERDSSSHPSLGTGHEKSFVLHAGALMPIAPSHESGSAGYVHTERAKVKNRPKFPHGYKKRTTANRSERSEAATKQTLRTKRSPRTPIAIRSDPDLPYGLTQRPSGKWQVQVFFAGRTRYIGVFEELFDLV